SLVRSSAIVPMLVMAARCFLRLSQMVMPVFSFGWRRKQSRLTPADARRCATKSPNESSPGAQSCTVKDSNRARAAENQIHSPGKLLRVDLKFRRPVHHEIDIRITGNNAIEHFVSLHEF